jgi:small subunit ribosomal protein S21
MPRVHCKNMNFDRALRIFRRKVENSGVLLEVRKKQYYEKPAQKKQRKMNAAKRRQEKITEAEKAFLAKRPNHWY